MGRADFATGARVTPGKSDPHVEQTITRYLLWDFIG